MSTYLWPFSLSFAWDNEQNFLTCFADLINSLGVITFNTNLRVSMTLENFTCVTDGIFYFEIGKWSSCVQVRTHQIQVRWMTHSVARGLLSVISPRLASSAAFMSLSPSSLLPSFKQSRVGWFICVRERVVSLVDPSTQNSSHVSVRACALIRVKVGGQPNFFAHTSPVSGHEGSEGQTTGRFFETSSRRPVWRREACRTWCLRSTYQSLTVFLPMLLSI